MPITYNGVGTHYYGKRNLDTRVHNCPHCGRHTTLSSYDTRLWFVVVFLPVIPLARKRIVDDCASCRRHYAVDLAKWHTMSQLEISGADEQYRATPTPEKAIALHQQLTAFHQGARAEQFSAEIAAKYNDNATVQGYLGSALDRQGRQGEALSHFTRALELRPDLPEARVGVAMDHIRHERLTEADRLLEFLDKPGSGQLYSLVPLEILATAFDRNQRPADALRCFERILSELPAAGKSSNFRKTIARLEKAAGRTESKIPKAKFSWREAFTIRNGDTGEPMVSRAGVIGFGALAALVVGVLIASNYFTGQHRKVVVVNGYADRLRFRVDGGSPTTLSSGSYHEVSAPEGAHSIAIEGSHPETVKFNVDGSFFSRWSGHPLWLINPGGAAVLQYETVTYSRAEVPPSMSLLYGQSFQKLENVTHLFEPLPKSVTLSRGTSQKVLTHLDYCDHPAEQIFGYLNAYRNRGEALAFAERHLKLNPGDEKLLAEYLQELTKKKETQRAENFFQTVLALRPVSIELHRAWQNFVEINAPDRNLAPVYDEFLAKEPNSSALLYLRGRIAHKREESVGFYEKALSADPKNAWAHYGLGFFSLAHGEWAKAKEHYGEAMKLAPANDSFAHYHTLASLAGGEAAQVESDLRARLEKEAHVRSIVALVPILGSQHKISDAESIITAFVRRLKQQMPSDAGPVVKPLRCLLAYSSQNFPELEKLSREGRTDSESTYLLTSALVEQNKVAEAETALSDKTERNAFNILTMSLAWELAGDAAKAKSWAERALTQLASGSRGDRVAHKLLTSAAPPSDDDFLALETDIRDRAIVAAYLKLHHPSESARFAKWVDAFNVECTYPYYLLKKVSARPLMTAGK